MSATDPLPITRYLRGWKEGGSRAGAESSPGCMTNCIVSPENLRGERPGHTLQPTALINEVYLRLGSGATPDWRNRAHFFAVAATTLRRILVDYARAHHADRRGGGEERVPLELAEAAVTCSYDDLLTIDDALTQLEVADPRAARVTELEVLCGLAGARDRGRVGGVGDHGQAGLEICQGLAGCAIEGLGIRSRRGDSSLSAEECYRQPRCDHEDVRQAETQRKADDLRGGSRITSAPSPIQHARDVEARCLARSRIRSRTRVGPDATCRERRCGQRRPQPAAPAQAARSSAVPTALPGKPRTQLAGLTGLRK